MYVLFHTSTYSVHTSIYMYVRNYMVSYYWSGFQMDSEDSGEEDVQSEEVARESEVESEEEEQIQKKRTRVKDTREWELMAK